MIDHLALALLHLVPLIVLLAQFAPSLHQEHPATSAPELEDKGLFGRRHTCYKLILNEQDHRHHNVLTSDNSTT